MCSAISLDAQVEICDNGIDDDNNGMIDLNDEDCFCVIFKPESLIPNPSFEETECCPSNRSELHCATDWIQASDPTTDFIHACGWLGWEQFPAPMPFPDGEGVMGFRDGRVRNGNPEPQWKEYAGACLISPMKAGTTYRFEFDIGFIDNTVSPPINISFFGTNDCQFLPFGVGDQEFGCPSNSSNWNKLADVNVSSEGQNTWVEAAIEITPEEDINAIAIGPDCPGVNTEVSLYYYFDNLILSDIEAFDLEITEFMHPCANDFTLAVGENSNFNYQWYKDGIALPGESSFELMQLYGDGDYQVRIIDENDCRLSESFEYIKPVFSVFPSISICEGEQFVFGDRTLTTGGFYIDTFNNVNNCDSIVMFNLSIIGERVDTISLNLFQGQTYDVSGTQLEGEGEFPLVLESSLGCDSFLLVRIAYGDVYIPNVFNPTSVLGNHLFMPTFAENLAIQELEILIFDRWGNQIHQGTNWDGGEWPSGVYVYRIDVQFAEGEPERFYGDITLLR